MDIPFPSLCIVGLGTIQVIFFLSFSLFSPYLALTYFFALSLSLWLSFFVSLKFRSHLPCSPLTKMLHALGTGVVSNSNSIKPGYMHWVLWDQSSVSWCSSTRTCRTFELLLLSTASAVTAEAGDGFESTICCFNQQFRSTFSVKVRVVPRSCSFLHSHCCPPLSHVHHTLN